MKIPGFINEIYDCLIQSGLEANIACGSIQTIECKHFMSGEPLRIIPLDIVADTPEEAICIMSQRKEFLKSFHQKDGSYPLIVPRDRWESSQNPTILRILAHLGKFRQIYARNCEVRRIDKGVASEFLEKYHSYGDANCRYRYGIFLKRYTGHLAAGQTCFSSESPILPGTLVAVATFSGARRWQKVDKIIRSYEWTRYASLPDVRISGGMGKVLGNFIKEVSPDDIMSYSDLEWSEGSVYEQLGFVYEADRAPVLFCVDPISWRRTPCLKPQEGFLYHQNFGSSKYRLKLTDYQ